jgi:hypothetical protein
MPVIKNPIIIGIPELNVPSCIVKIKRPSMPPQAIACMLILK